MKVIEVLVKFQGNLNSEHCYQHFIPNFICPSFCCYNRISHLLLLKILVNDH